MAINGQKWMKSIAGNHSLTLGISLTEKFTKCKMAKNEKNQRVNMAKKAKIAF